MKKTVVLLIVLTTITSLLSGCEESVAQNAISLDRQEKYNEIAIGIGGPHYCPNFNLIQAKSNTAIAHIIPQYSLPLTQEMVIQAIDKTQEEVDLALVDWKGLGNAEQRQQALDILDKLHIRYKRTNEVRKEI